MAIYDKASLVLIPSGSKTSKVYSQKPTNGDGDFTFSRSTAATRVNASGNIEKETQNLITYSNGFDSWGQTGVSVTSGQSGYDGSSDAWLLTTNASQGRVQQTLPITSGVYTLSCYMKQGTNTRGVIRMNQNGSEYVAYFELDSGTAASVSGNVIASAIEDKGNGWYRCSAAFITTTSSNSVGLGSAANGSNWTATTSGNIYIQDAQLEQGLVARDYIETTTTAIYGGITDNVPRLDYTDSSCPALLLEPQRTNVVVNSEYFGASNWTLGGAGAIDTNSTTSPEGFENATKFKANSTSTIHSQIENIAASRSFTIFAKQGEESQMLIYGGTAAVAEGIVFDLSDGSFVKYWNNNSDHIDSYSSTDYGNGWYRYEINFDADTKIRLFIANNGQITFPQTSGNGIYIYGAQLEAGSYATSYIPTYGSAVTRNVESAQGLNIPQMPTSYPFTLYGEGYVQPSGDDYVMSFINGTSSNTYFSLRILNRYPKANSRTGTGEYTATGTILPVGRYKTAVIYTDTQIKMYVNGELMDSVSNANSFTTGMDDLLLGQLRITADSGSRMPVYQAMVFNQELTDQEAIDLTTL